MHQNNKLYLSQSIWWSGIQEQLGVGRQGHSGSGSLMRLQSRHWLGLQLSKGSNGDRGSISMKFHSHGCWQKAPVPNFLHMSQFLTSCLLEALVPHDMGLSTGCLSVFTAWQITSPRSSKERQTNRQTEKLQYLLCRPLWNCPLLEVSQ